MKRQFTICALFVFALIASAQAAPGAGNPAPQAPSGRPVARVNGAVLTDRDLLREMNTIFPYARQHGGVFPSGLEPQIRQGAMEMMVFEELVYQDAVRRKMAITPARLQQALQEFRKQFKTPDDYQHFMQLEVNNSQEVLKTKVRRALLIEQLMNQEVSSRAAVSIAEAKAFFDKNPDRFRVPESYALQTISIVPPKNPTPAQREEARKKAESALKQAKLTQNYEQFGLLAEKISEDDFRVVMGDHKLVDRTQLPPPVAQAVSALKPGEMSGLIQVDQLYAIIRLNAHTPARMRKFEEVRDSVREHLQKMKTEQLRSAWDKKLRATAKVEEL